MGNDPKSSVLDLNCKAHDLDNLYIVDAACFVFASAVNPSLTIIANAIRIAEHLLEVRLKSNIRDPVALKPEAGVNMTSITCDFSQPSRPFPHFW